MSLVFPAFGGGGRGGTPVRFEWDGARWLRYQAGHPHVDGAGTDLEALTEADIQEIAMTLNLTPRKCLGFRTPLEAYLNELGKSLETRFA